MVPWKYHGVILLYILVDDKMKLCHPSFYFSRFLLELLSVRLFMASNTLAHNLRKALYLQPESTMSKKSFWLPMFSMEVFWYLVYLLMGKSIGTSIVQKQRTAKYLRCKCTCYILKSAVMLGSDSRMMVSISLSIYTRDISLTTIGTVLLCNDGVSVSAEC